ncbi:MAG: type II secretion system minor pseudopilin GspK [Pseudomonadota bacterium]|jgi:general secretion pathway protein K
MKQRQHGIALITALLVLAIAVVLAASLAHEGALALRRSENLLHHAQAAAYLQGAEDWARRILTRDAREVDHLGEAWATPLPPIPVEGGEITGRLIDLQGRLNLNALLASDNSLAPLHARRLACLLQKAGIERPEAALETLADWQDQDGEVRPLGAEDGAYANLPHPYRTGNQPLLAAGELALIQGFSAEAVARLTTLTAALPKDATLNLNTAPPEVLACLGEGLTPEDWRAFLETRAKTPLKKVDELLAQAPFQGRLDAAGLGVTSQVFLLEAEARIGRTVARRYSVLLRETNGTVRVQSRFQENP